MNFVRLENNVIDVIKEEQMKLGYRSEIIRLYYPLKSLNRLLNTELDLDEMQKTLSSSWTSDHHSVLGQVIVTHKADRFCLMIPAAGVDYVHAHTAEKEFIRDFIEMIGKHDCRIEEIVALFHQYSNQVHFEKIEDGEFDYLIYFEEGQPDDYRYCLTDEGCHMIYHRFTPEDYVDFEA